MDYREAVERNDEENRIARLKAADADERIARAELLQRQAEEQAARIIIQREQLSRQVELLLSVLPRPVDAVDAAARERLFKSVGLPTEGK